MLSQVIKEPDTWSGEGGRERKGGREKGGGAVGGEFLWLETART